MFCDFDEFEKATIRKRLLNDLAKNRKVLSSSEVLWFRRNILTDNTDLRELERELLRKNFLNGMLKKKLV